MRTVTCPAKYCLDGEVSIACETCKGTGVHLDEYGREVACDTCGGDMGVLIPCELCMGRGTVHWAFAKLYESDSYVRKVDECWSGNTRDYTGVTAYALASWFRVRHRFLGRIEYVIGIPSAEYTTASLVLIKSREEVISLWGLSWGYDGDGPLGLAAILDDIGFETHMPIREYVSELQDNRPWVINQTDHPEQKKLA